MIYSGENFVELETLKQHLDITDSNDDTQLLALIKWASRFIERSTGQPQSPITKTIKVSPLTDKKIRLPYAIRELTEIVNGDDDNTIINESEYNLYPVLGDIYYSLELKSTTSTVLKSPVTITGIWGLETDEEIKLATILIVSRVMNEAYEDGLATLTTDFAMSSFQREVLFNPVVKNIIIGHKIPIELG